MKTTLKLLGLIVRLSSPVDLLNLTFEPVPNLPEVENKDPWTEANSQKYQLPKEHGHPIVLMIKVKIGQDQDTKSQHHH